MYGFLRFSKIRSDCFFFRTVFFMFFLFERSLQFIEQLLFMVFIVVAHRLVELA
jgi:hypothetical protein